jgi:hypothetical protein
MTIKDLQKLIESQEQSTEIQDPKIVALLERVRNKRLFGWDDKTHKQTLDSNYDTTKRNCCFTCILGWPEKNGKKLPLFDYERDIVKSLTIPSYINATKMTEEDERWYEEGMRSIEQKAGFNKQSIHAEYSLLLKERQNRMVDKKKLKHLAILKAGGLGITELVLRFILHVCLRNNDLTGSQVVLFVGPRIELAISLMGRLKGLLKNKHDIVFTDKETVLNVNGVHIECFPSHHADSARGLPNISIIFVDECCFLPDREVDNITDIMLRNIPKSNPFLICVSTPNKPNDFMDKLFQEKPEDTIWKRMKLDYTWGIDKIFDSDEILKIKNSRSFEREFNLKFAGLAGNVLSPEAVDKCITTGLTLAETAPIDNWDIPTKYVMSIDIGWGSSNTAIIVSRYVNGKVQIIHSQEMVRPLFSDVLNIIWQLYHKCNGRDRLRNILVDASATELYTALCNEFDINPSQKYLADKQKWCKERNVYLGDHMYLCPIPFNPQGRYMLNHAQRMIEFQESNGSAIIGIHPQFEDLITSCRSAYAVEDKLDKDRGVFADSFDSLLMNLSWYKWSK